MTIRKFINASLGHRMKMRETWEQARMISYYTASPHFKKGFKISDIWIPGDNERKVNTTRQSQGKKEDLYRILDKWNK